MLLISTVEKSTAIQPYCDITYSIVRHGDVNAICHDVVSVVVTGERQAKLRHLIGAWQWAEEE